jgi:hypothetical protein
MRRGEDETAGGQMRPHNFGEPGLGRGVKRAGGLVEQPDRAFDGEQAGDREPAALPGGKIGGRQVDASASSPTAASGSVISAEDVPKKADPESKVFGDRKRGLQRILVTEVVRLLGDGQFRVATLEAELALRRCGPGRRWCAAATICPRRCGR